MNRKNILIILFVIANTLMAQDQVIEKIIAIVGDQIIMSSDIAIRKNQLQSQGVKNMDDCQVFENLFKEKILLNQAILDSVEVSEGEVESELERRIRYFMQMMGSKEKLEEFYGKSVLEIKDEFRIEIKKQLLITRIQQQITAGTSVSPAEVKAFFAELPSDSVPLFNTMLEVGQIAVIPEPSKFQDSTALSRATELRARALNGEDFSTLALIYSDDPGSARQGGDLGFQERGTFVPEFEEAAYKISKGEISEIVKTQFGYHVLQGVERRGESVRVKHVLIKPKIMSIDMKSASEKMDSILTELRAGRLSFEKGVARFSDDEFTKSSGGLLMNNESASTFFEPDQMEHNVYFAIEKLEPGQYTEPQYFATPDGKKGMRILYLKAIVPQHKASLSTDYDKIKSIVNSQKQAEQLDQWFKDRVEKNYIKIDSAYDKCSNLL